MGEPQWYFIPRESPVWGPMEVDVKKDSFPGDIGQEGMGVTGNCLGGRG